MNLNITNEPQHQEPQNESWIERTAANYLEAELSKDAFFTFLRESSELKKDFHQAWGETLSPGRPLSRPRLAMMFNDVGARLAQSGNTEGARRSFACSSLFIKGNPLTWAAIAESECARKDRVAAAWANKVTAFRLQKSTSVQLRELLSSEEAKSRLRDAKRQMKEVILVCELNPWWQDTSALIEKMGASREYFDR
jgi:hypothetical protein